MNKLLIMLFLIFSTAIIAQVDSVRVTWVDPTLPSTQMLYIYGDTTAATTTLRDSIVLAEETWYWQPPYAGLWYFRMRARTSEYVYSSYSNEDTATIGGGGGFTPADLNPVLNLQYGDSVVTYSAFNTTRLYSWIDNGLTFLEIDTSNGAPVVTDSSYEFITTSRFTATATYDTGHFLNVKYDDWTIEAWIIPDLVNVGWFFNKYNYVFGTTNAEGVHLQFLFGDGVLPDAGISTYDVNPAFTGFLANTWYHVVVVLDRDYGCTLYINGDSIITETGTEWTDFDGLNLTEGSTANEIGYSQAIDHIWAIRVYRAALTHVNISDLHNYGRPE